MPDAHTIFTALILVSGTGVFLRLVAKEKHRREKHLQLRVIQKAEELRKEEESRQMMEKAQGKKQASVTATPVTAPG